MTRTLLLRAGLVAAFVAAGSVFVSDSPRPVAAQPTQSPRPSLVVGATSCAAASCHGNDGAKGAAGSEYHTFAEYDPHRRAFSVLFQERSDRMVRLLAAGAAHAPAHQTALCLRCHGATPPNVTEPVPATSELHRTASCENCHGAASNWLTDHFTRDWKALSLEEKAARGMVVTKDPATRVKLCAGCHVGEPGREVDHKLIAAGHPALRFEFAGFQAEPVYAKHWREKAGPDVEAWMWAIGQVGTARAAAELLRHRAAGAQDRDWPELAEYTCYSCHQGLTPTERGLREGQPRAGMLPWGSWYYPVVSKMSDGSLGAWCQPSQKPGGLSAVAQLFHRTDRPSPKAAETEAARAVADLDRWLVELQAGAAKRGPLTPDELRLSLRATVRFTGDVPRTNAPSTDWDRYTQGFLATAALYRASCAVDPARRDPATEADLRAAAARLRFPDADTDAPRKWTAAEFEEFHRRWAALAARLDAGGRP